MNWLDKLERKFPKFGIPNITIYLVACNVLGYILSYTKILDYLTFDMSYILQGQVWRLVSWILVPSGSVSSITSLILEALFLFCAASWGKSLEQMLGTFRMTVFVIGGLLISVIGGCLYYVLTGALLGWSNGLSVYLTTYYIILSILMEIAILFPDGQVRLWFILPIRMKWMLWITLAELAYEVGRYFYLTIRMYAPTYGVGIAILVGFVYAGSILLALLNLLVFYLASRNHASRKQRKRQQEFKQQYRAAEPRPGSGIARHKCAICGRTELDCPDMLFRYCSKCSQGQEYCSDHLFNHVHK